MEFPETFFSAFVRVREIGTQRFNDSLLTIAASGNCFRRADTLEIIASISLMPIVERVYREQ